MTATPSGDPARPDQDERVMLSAGRYDSFVVRVFSHGGVGDLMHGEVTHVATRRMQRFSDLQGALAFMAAAIEEPSTVLDPIDHD